MNVRQCPCCGSNFNIVRVHSEDGSAYRFVRCECCGLDGPPSPTDYGARAGWDSQRFWDMRIEDSKTGEEIAPEVVRRWVLENHYELGFSEYLGGLCGMGPEDFRTWYGLQFVNRGVNLNPEWEVSPTMPELWHLENYDGTRWLDWEIKERMPSPDMVPMIDMYGNLSFVRCDDCIEPECSMRVIMNLDRVVFHGKEGETPKA